MKTLRSAFLLLAVCAASAVGQTSGNLVVNGNFSAGNTGFTSDYTYVASGTSTTPGTYGIRTASQDFNPAYAAFADHTSGTGQMMLVDGGTPTQAVWTETIGTSENTRYVFSFWATPADNINQPVLRVLINGVQVGTDFDLSTVTPGTWTQFGVTWDSGTATNAVITIQDVNPNSVAAGDDFALDDIRFYAVPANDVYRNVDIQATPPSVDVNGGATGATTVTKLTADDLTFDTSLAGENVTRVGVVLDNTGAQATTFRVLLRFYNSDGTNGGPGTLLASYDFGPVTLGPGAANAQPFYFALPAGSFILPSSGTVWAGIAFDNGGGSTATAADLNKLGIVYFNPPTVGTSADRLFYSDLDAAGYTTNNPAGTVTDNPNGGNPPGNLGWELQASPVGTCVAAPADMVAWWAGDGNANDSQGSSGAVLENGASFGTGEVGLGFRLDGVDDYVLVPDNSSIDLPGAITVDAWINPTNIGTTNQAIINKSDVSTNQEAFTFQITPTGSLEFLVSGSGDTSNFTGVTTADNIVQPGVFTHVAATFDPSTQAVRIYVNGNEVATTAITGSTNVTALFDSNQPIRIGAELNQNGQLAGFFGGVIDEVELFSRALNPAEIGSLFSAGSAGKCKPQCVAPPADLVSWYTGDGEAFDLAGNNNGIFAGAVNGVTFSPGKVGQAFNFNGSGYVSVNDNTTLNPTNQITVDSWVNTTSSGSFEGMVSKFNHSNGNVTDDSYNLSLETDGRVRWQVVTSANSSGYILDSPNPINDGAWHFVAGTYDGTTMRLYVDGVEVASAAASGTITSSTTPLYIGGGLFADAPNYFTGMLDEVEIFSRALTATEVSDIFNAGGAGKCKAIPTEGEFGNISTRVYVGIGDNVPIAGFIIKSDASPTPAPAKRVLIRAIGPSIKDNTGSPLAGRLLDPMLTLYDKNGNAIASNDNWQTAGTCTGTCGTSSDIQTSGLAPTDTNEAAILITLPADAEYTAVMRGKNDTVGIGLVEVYDLDPTNSSHLVNISTRGFVETGDNVMIGGIIIRGATDAEVIVRALGPSLAARGVPNVLADPQLDLRDAQGNRIELNDNWTTSPEKDQITTDGLAPTDNNESAILATLPPGAYTAIVSGVGSSPTGNALVEFYRIGPPASP